MNSSGGQKIDSFLSSFLNSIFTGKWPFTGSVQNERRLFHSERQRKFPIYPWKYHSKLEQGASAWHHKVCGEVDLSKPNSKGLMTCDIPSANYTWLASYFSHVFAGRQWSFIGAKFKRVKSREWCLPTGQRDCSQGSLCFIKSEQKLVKTKTML